MYVPGTMLNMKYILPYLILTEPNGVVSHFHLHVKKQKLTE